MNGIILLYFVVGMVVILLTYILHPRIADYVWEKAEKAYPYQVPMFFVYTVILAMVSPVVLVTQLLHWIEHQSR